MREEEDRLTTIKWAHSGLDTVYLESNREYYTTLCVKGLLSEAVEIYEQDM